MADIGSLTPGIRLDIQQLQLEAQHRWLRPAEICEILRHYQKFQISSEPPNLPPSGSLFLFDRKVLRYFRKDGHNWRKKKDGKTVKEAHEKLKVGSVDVLHCYYAHGEDNEYFQRRSYWLLEEEYMHIVFVHYLTVKGNRSSLREVEPVRSSSPMCSSLSSSVSTSYNDDVESEDNYQAMSKYAASMNFPLAEDNFENNKMGGIMSSNLLTTTNDYKGVQLSAPGLNYVALPQKGSGYNNEDNLKALDLESWEEVLEQCTKDSGVLPSQPATIPSTLLGGGNTDDYNGTFSQLLDVGFGITSNSGGSVAPCISQVYIYSSGSRLAQRHLFGYTKFGDLRKYLSGFFDTNVGNKRETRSYIEICQSLGVDNPSQILFVTDVYQEATAAFAAGLEVVISVRPGNGPLHDNHGFKIVNSFAGI